MDLTQEQIDLLTARLGTKREAWLRNATVEPHYSAEKTAELLEVTVRTVWNYVELYETSGGRDGIGPVVKISHKVVRIPASALNRFLQARTVDAAALVRGKENAA